MASDRKNLSDLFAKSAARAPKIVESSAKEAQRVLQCPSCGAPQEQAQVFTCAYCGSAIVGPGKGR